MPITKEHADGGCEYWCPTCRTSSKIRPAQRPRCLECDRRRAARARALRPDTIKARVQNSTRRAKLKRLALAGVIPYSVLDDEGIAYPKPTHIVVPPKDDTEVV